MGLIISVLRSETLKNPGLLEHITMFCDDVILKDHEILLIPRPGKLIALLERLNQQGVAYHFPQAEHDDAL